MAEPETKRILLWDNDGTIMGSRNPLDTNDRAKVILPHVAETMAKAAFNFVISGFKSPESEAQDFDPIAISKKFQDLMAKLPIQAADFSPLIGGVGCYVVLKNHDGTVTMREAHKDPSYAEYIGRFKKPDRYVCSDT